MTHHHRDQGQGLPLAVEHGARIHVPPVEIELFDRVEEMWESRQLDNDYNLRQDRFSLLESVPVHAAVPEYRELHLGAITVRVIPTPGHTIGSVTYLLDLGGSVVAFTGDLIHSPGKVVSLAATQWSYTSNFQGIPTDCPHREKNGWLGDAHLAGELAMLNFQNGAAYTKWIRDLKDEMRQSGELPGIVPTRGERGDARPAGEAGGPGRADYLRESVAGEGDADLHVVDRPARSARREGKQQLQPAVALRDGVAIFQLHAHVAPGSIGKRRAS
jgi:hypothetical protein